MSDNWKVVKEDEIEAIQLLEECLYFINQVPNKKYSTKTGETSYELASKISKYLKK